MSLYHNIMSLFDYIKFIIFFPFRIPSINNCMELMKKDKLKLDDFIEIRKVMNDNLNKIENGITILEYYTKDKESLLLKFLEVDPYYDPPDSCIGYIKYKKTGQIGLFFINEEYQNRGLGKQILNKAIDELKIYGCKEVWVVTSDNHLFWSNVYNKQFIRRKPAHPLVCGGGYYINLDNFSYN